MGQLAKELHRLARDYLNRTQPYVVVGFRYSGSPIYQHRVVAEWILGRRLGFEEQVHHINGNSRDNRPCNLQVVPKKEHYAAHERATGYPIVIEGYPRLGEESHGRNTIKNRKRRQKRKARQAKKQAKAWRKVYFARG